MPVVVDERCSLHDPRHEIWIGVATPAAETAERLTAIRHALAGARFVTATEHPREKLAAVHDDDLLDYLESAWDEWKSAGLPREPGQERVVPYVFAHAGLMAGRPPTVPVATWARPGYFAYDTMTLVGPGTWDAARGAADGALTAVDLVVKGEPAAYACVRPPGHHVTRSAYGGSCYLNNAAIAAAELARRVGTVAVLDIDAHHGNGTQEIFYPRGDVVTGSVHVDPGAGWFPHFLGFADETGGSGGEGANRNIPLAPGTGDDEWLEAVRALVDWTAALEPSALVVPLGVDAADEDPESPLRVTANGFRAAGQELRRLGVPTVLVQEGGYNLQTIGALVHETLAGFEQ
jgi:acetoin utilization deacetylase AcuC-like enzyme